MITITKKKLTLENLLSQVGATCSVSEGRRYITGQSVKLNGFVVDKLNVEAEFHVGDVIEIGKRKFTITDKHLS